MSIHSSPQSTAYKANVKLCRAMAKQPILYDRNHGSYRKRQPSDKCWLLVATETGASVEKCKRRWRTIRKEYNYWQNFEVSQKTKGVRRTPSLVLTHELQFLIPHFSGGSEIDSESIYEEEEEDLGAEPKLAKGTESDKEKEEDSNRKSTEKDLPVAVANKSNAKDIPTLVEQEAQAEQDLSDASIKTTEKDKSEKEVKQKKSDKQSKAVETAEDDEKQSEGDKEEAEQSEDIVTKSASKNTEFFVKQTSNSTSTNRLIIGKKISNWNTDNVFQGPLEPNTMGDDSGDETMSLGGGRRTRRSTSRSIVNTNAIQKKTATRLTRLQRNKSMCLAVEENLRGTSPVKMTPLPKTTAQPKSPSKSASIKTPTKPTNIQKVQKNNNSNNNNNNIDNNNSKNNDDIFPRPQSTVPVGQLVLARRPGQTLPQPQLLSQATVRVVTSAGGTPRIPLIASVSRPITSVSPKDIPPIVVSNSNTLVFSTASIPVKTISSIAATNANTNSITNPAISSLSSNVTSLPATATTVASSVMSTAKIVRTPGQSTGTQTECVDIFSDDHFLDLLRPQMREMNSRQKLHFKQKVYRSLMETFDDATDFPGSGEVQHFNINTPSGFENVSDSELRLIRELVSMVSAGKRTSLGPVSPTKSPVGSAKPPQNVVTQRAPRIAQLPPHATGGTTPEDKRTQRALPLAVQSASVRQDSVDSNVSVSARSSNGVSARTVGRSPFAVPQNLPKPTTQRSQDPLGLTPETSTQAIRLNNRRFSVCGAVSTESYKRRIVVVNNQPAVPAQRARFQGPQTTGQTTSIIAPANSPLVTRTSPAVPQKQTITTAGGATVQKVVQSSANQRSALNNPQHNAPRISPVKAALVVANVKGVAQQRANMVTALRQSVVLANQDRTLPTIGSGVANLLADNHPNPPKAAPAQYQHQTAGIIAADDFDISRLKREPQDLSDIDILGM